MPNEYAVWHEAIASARSQVSRDRDEFIAKVNAKTPDDVRAEMLMMTDYEIYNKLQGNIHRLKDVENIDSALILLLGKKSTTDCYRVLGEIHALYPASSLSSGLYQRSAAKRL